MIEHPVHGTHLKKVSAWKNCIPDAICLSIATSGSEIAPQLQFHRLAVAQIAQGSCAVGLNLHDAYAVASNAFASSRHGEKRLHSSDSRSHPPKCRILLRMNPVGSKGQQSDAHDYQLKKSSPSMKKSFAFHERPADARVQ